MMTKDEYFAAVLMIAGPPSDRIGLGASYETRVLDAMVRLAPEGPRMALGYADFLTWCREQCDG